MKKNINPIQSAKCKKLAYGIRSKSAARVDCEIIRGDNEAGGDIVQVRQPPTGADKVNRNGFKSSEIKTQGKSINLQAVGQVKLKVERTKQDKDKLPNKICLDGRGLSSIPHIVNEPELKLLSLQHNLINSLNTLCNLDVGHKLIFLDLYNNQIDRIIGLDLMINLRVLLIGKNRIKQIEGLNQTTKLEVLDLHGNRITKVSGLSCLCDLKMLNLAGNQIRALNQSDLNGLSSLRELNLKRNRLKKLLGFEHTPKLEKLYLSKNELQCVEDMSSLAIATELTAVTLDGNPVYLGGDCIPFLVAYLPKLTTISGMSVTDVVKKAAYAWRKNKETANAAFAELGAETDPTAHRNQVIQNARTNWELLRTDFKCLTLDNIKAIEGTDNTKLDRALHKKQGPQLRRMQSFTAKTEKTKKRVNFLQRSASQDTETSNTSDINKLPPILLPIIDSLENVKISNENLILKHWDSSSSVEAAADSSMSSLLSSSSESEKVKNVRMTTASTRRANFIASKSKSVADPQARPKTGKTDDNSSTLSGNTNSNSIPSNGSSSTEKCVKRTIKSLMARNVKSATGTRKNESPGSNRVGTAKGKRKTSSRRTESPTGKVDIEHKDPVRKDREQGVDFMVEVNDGTLCLWGADSIKRLDTWTSNGQLKHASFNYITFPSIANLLGRLKTKFPNITELTFKATGLQYLGQIHVLAELRGLKTLTVIEEGNPITSKPWREYAVYRLAHWGLKEINDVEVTDTEIRDVNETYSGLSDMIIRILPEAPLVPLVSRLGKNNIEKGAKRWLYSADRALKNVVAKEALQWKRGAGDDTMWRTKGLTHLTSVADHAIDIAERLQLLEREWTSIMTEMIEDTLKDFKNLDGHIKQCMSQIQIDSTSV